MSTDWKALCAELAQQLDDALDFTVSSETRRYMKELTGRARAALAAEADGPAVPEGREPASVVGEPSDEELLRIAAEAIDPYDKIGLGEYEAETERAVEAYGSELIAFARAVLARYSHQPAPPAEGEVGELVEWLSEEADQYDCISQAPEESRKLRRAAALLEQRHPTPVPVSERLPGPEDCDAEGNIWAWRRFDPEGDMDNGDFWCLAFCEWLEDEDCGYTHWLSYPSLPLPDQK